jgi:hypothetical protein
MGVYNVSKVDAITTDEATSMDGRRDRRRLNLFHGFLRGTVLATSIWIGRRGCSRHARSEARRR